MSTLTQERTISVYGHQVHASPVVRTRAGRYTAQVADRNKSNHYTGLSGWLALAPEAPGEGEMAPATTCSGGQLACPCRSVI